MDSLSNSVASPTSRSIEGKLVYWRYVVSEITDIGFDHKRR